MDYHSGERAAGQHLTYYNMANMRSQQSSVYYDKIFGQPNRHSINYGLNIGEYVNSGSLMQSSTLKRNVGQDVVSPPAVPGEVRPEKRSAVRRPSVDLILVIVAGTMTAPIERVKLLIQNQNEMLKTGRLLQPYEESLTALLVLLSAKASNNAPNAT